MWGGPLFVSACDELISYAKQAFSKLFEAIDGSQPLHVAAAGGHPEVAKVLRLSSIRHLSWIQFNGLN